MGECEENQSQIQGEAIYKNKLLTMHVQISYNMRKHLRNVLTVVIGGSWFRKEPDFLQKPNLMQAKYFFVVFRIQNGKRSF